MITVPIPQTTGLCSRPGNQLQLNSHHHSCSIRRTILPAKTMSDGRCRSVPLTFKCQVNASGNQHQTPFCTPLVRLYVRHRHPSPGVRELCGTVASGERDIHVLLVGWFGWWHASREHALASSKPGNRSVSRARVFTPHEPRE